MKTILNYDREGHENFIANLKVFTNILPAAVDELKKQGIEISKDLTFYSLMDGNFVEVFNKYHRAKKQKNEVTKKMLYPRYLDLYGYNSATLENLENNYKNYLKRDFQFYPMNNAFYRHCELRSNNDPKLRSIYEKAPAKKSYLIFDFVKVKGNDITINVPSELFTLFTTNKKQEGITEKVNELLDLAQELGLEYKSIKSALKAYLVEDKNTWGLPQQIGLSEDFRIINFDYNRILQIQ